LYIFDLDGTLIDTRKDLTVAVNQMLALYGLESKSIDEVTSYVGDGLLKLVERCIGDNGVNISEALSAFKKAYSDHLLDTTRLYPGIREVLDRLRRCKALLTNKSYDLSKEIMDRLELADYFTLIVGGNTLKTKKPSSEGVEYILAQTGFPRDKAVMIGDGKNDILAAREAGVASVYVTYGFTHLENVKGFNPDFIIRRPQELLAIC